MGKKRFEASGMVSGILLPMGLICVFAFCTLVLAIMGGSAYKGMQTNINAEYTNVIGANYLRTKITQNNAGAVQVRDEAGCQVLVVKSGDEGFETRIFVYEGFLKESYVSSESGFMPAGGTVITEVGGCEFAVSPDGLFEALVENPGGEQTRVAIALTGGGEA